MPRIAVILARAVYPSVYDVGDASAPGFPMSESSHYARASVELRRELFAALPEGQLADLQRRRPWKHFGVLAALLTVLVASMTGSAHYDRWTAWVPCSIVAGFCLFCFTV